MTDRDVVERVAEMFGKPITTKERSSSGYKDVYSVRVWGEQAAGWIADLYEHFGNRRQAKAREALSAFSESWPKNRLSPEQGFNICKRNHLIESEADLFYSKTSEQTWCKQCKRADKLRKVVQRGAATGFEHRARLTP